MAREIKFRGWDGETKRMWSWREMEHTHFCASLYSHGDGSWEVMQYTGLRDKNGTEIYEGDIVKGHYFANGRKNRIIGTVEFEVGFRVIGVKKYQGWPCELNSLFEVIGNIYENPDLI